MEDCFEGIICFETLNPTDKGDVPVAEDDADVDPISRIEVFDIDKYLSHPDASLVLPRTPVVCKPFEGAYEKVFNIANINPQRTVRI